MHNIIVSLLQKEEHGWVVLKGGYNIFEFHLYDFDMLEPLDQHLQ